MEPAYAAGLFDGEGTVRVDEFHIPAGPGRPKAYKRQQLLVAIAMSHYPTIRALYDRFGGSISRDTSAHRRNPNHSIRYTWKVWSGLAMDFLIAVQPFLITKKEQAQLAIKFQRHVRRCDPLFRKHRGVPPSLNRIREYRAKLIAELQHHKAGRFDVPKDKLLAPSQKWPYASVSAA